MQESNYPRHREWERLFLNSFELFWPLKFSNTSLQLIIDKEKLGPPDTPEHDLFSKIFAYHMKYSKQIEKIKIITNYYDPSSYSFEGTSC